MTDHDHESTPESGSPGTCSACGADLFEALEHCPVCGKRSGAASVLPFKPRSASSSTPWRDLALAGAAALLVSGVALGAATILWVRWQGDATPVAALTPVDAAPIEPVAPVEPTAEPDLPAGENPPEPDPAEAVVEVSPPPAADPVVRATSSLPPPGLAEFAEGLELERQARLYLDQPDLSRQWFREAARHYQSSLEDGYAPALVQLGDLYAEENGPMPSPETALRHYRRAAKAGLEKGRTRAINLVDRSEPGSVHCPEYIDWLQEAASAGDGLALLKLGRRVMAGQYTERNPGRAVELFRLAVKQGHSVALIDLGNIYMSESLGRPKPDRAFAYFHRAAQEGYPAGLDSFLGWTREQMIAGVEKETPGIEPGQELVLRKTTGLVMHGPYVSLDAGVLSLRQEGGVVQVRSGEIDLKARRRIDPAFRQEVADTRTLEYLLKLGVEEPSATLQMALAEQGLPPLEDAPHQRVRGLSWYRSEVEESDYPRAFLWLHLAARRGDPIAQHLVGRLYYDGKGVMQSEGLALGWLEQAAAAPYAPARAFIQHHWERVDNIQQLQARAKSELLRDREQHTRALNSISRDDLYVTFFSSGGDGMRVGAQGQ